MRISSGVAKGTRLRAPKGVRPASERVRQAVLTSLGSRVDDARVLDLYSGSGAWGLEALSRGAATLVAVDADRAAVAATSANAAAAGFEAVTTVRRRDVQRYLDQQASADGPFDLVFADPPYTLGPPPHRLLGSLSATLDASGVVVWEMRAGDVSVDPPDGWTLEGDRRYGDTRVLMIERGTR